MTSRLAWHLGPIRRTRRHVLEALAGEGHGWSSELSRRASNPMTRPCRCASAGHDHLPVEHKAGGKSVGRQQCEGRGTASVGGLTIELCSCRLVGGCDGLAYRGLSVFVGEDLDTPRTVPTGGT